MLNDIRDYTKKIEAAIRQNPPDFPWSGELEYFHRLLMHFQQERLIHLIVTMTVGLATLISIFITLLHPLIYFFILNLILSLLFIAYLFHYRKLENTAQSCYPLLNRLKEKAFEQSKS